MDDVMLKLRRVFSVEAKKVNALLADEEIAPTALLGHTATNGTDLLPFLSDERNIALVCEDASGELRGAVLFAWIEPGVYEVHTMAQRVVRGKTYIHAVREAIRIMFVMSDAIELYTRIPQSNRAALGLVRAVYGKRQFLRADETPMYVLRFSDWLWGPLGEPCVARGKWFHSRLEEQFTQQGRVHVQHEDNSDHDRMVGITCDMLLACMVEKALILYNRWAKLAGYAECRVVVPSPLVLNIGDALLQIDFPQRDFILLESKPEDLVASISLDTSATSRLAH